MVNKIDMPETYLGSTTNCLDQLSDLFVKELKGRFEERRFLQNYGLFSQLLTHC